MAEGKTQLPHQLLIGRPQGYYLFRLTSLPSGPPAEPDEFCFYSAKTSAAASLCYVVDSHVCKAPPPSTTCLKCNPTCTSPQFIPTSLCSQPAETLFLISSLFFSFLFLMGAQCAALIVGGYCTEWPVCETWSGFSRVILKCLYFCTLSQTLLFAHFIRVNMLSMLTYLGFCCFVFFFPFFEILRYFYLFISTF